MSQSDTVKRAPQVRPDHRAFQGDPPARPVAGAPTLCSTALGELHPHFLLNVRLQAWEAALCAQACHLADFLMPRAVPGTQEKPSKHFQVTNCLQGSAQSFLCVQIEVKLAYNLLVSGV